MGKRYFKFIIFFCCTVVILFFLVTLILPSTGKVVKETYIQARKKTVLMELNTLEGYPAWYPWLQVDPTALISYKDETRQMRWSSKSAPREEEGSYQLTGQDGDSAIHFTFTYKDSRPFTGAYILRSDNDTSGTTVIWYIKMNAGFTPWWRFYAAMMGKLAGPLMEAGLSNLKVISEKAESFTDVPFKKLKVPKTYVAYLRSHVSSDLLYSCLNSSFDTLKSFISLNHLKISGDPMAQFHELNNRTFIIHAGIPVSEKFVPEGPVQLMVLPAGSVLSSDYMGSYGGVENTYLALSHLATRFGKQTVPAVWEIYKGGIIPQSDTSYCRINVRYSILPKTRTLIHSIAKR